MNLSWIDWLIVAVSVLLIRLVSWKTRSLMRGVADFLSANRLAGRYLLTIGGEMGNFGVITLVAGWQAFTSAGFPTIWWAFLAAPLTLVYALTGWVYYRLRETRALTVAQFFEIRYSRRFRIFAGLLCYVSGILNFGIFPAIAARFLIYFCGLPQEITLPGAGFHVAMFPLIMALDLGIALFFVNSGGQISVMVTECAQGMVACFAYLAIAIAVVVLVPWQHEVAALQTAPINASLLNPFHTGQTKDFNVAFYLIGIFLTTYAYRTWLGGQGYMTAARTPHEQRMGTIIQGWRSMPLGLMSLLLPLAAFTLLHDPHYAPLAAHINHTIGLIGSKSIQDEMTVPIALAQFLPVGIKGLLVMVVVFLSFTCHDTYMHAWGSIFIQDVVLPIRNRPFETQEQIKWLRWSIAFVALFAFCFSLIYTEPDKLLYFQAITGTIWLGGAGAIMLGGLYSRFGTTAGAYAALISGGLLGVADLVVPKLWEQHHADKFPINGQWLALFGSLVSLSLYLLVSFATGGRQRPFNLEKMLHRGIYSGGTHDHDALSTPTKRWQEMLGLGKEFSPGDRVLAIVFAVYTFGWWAIFLAISLLHFQFGLITDLFWQRFWHGYILAQLIACVPIIIWFTVGGVLDIRALVRALQTAVRNPLDDGRVLHAPASGASDAAPILGSQASDGISAAPSKN